MSSTMRELINRINALNYAYYVQDDPLVSDAQWDALYSQLQQMERETGVVEPDSPTRRVGSEPLETFETHVHLARLWSMDKAQNHQQLEAWAARVEKLKAEYSARTGETLAPTRYCVEYKFDGLTINLTYRGGKLAEAATRGNGQNGESILPQVKTIASIPLTIPYQGLMEVQGESYMRLSRLARYNRTAAEPLKNARNAAAGALRNLDARETAKRRLDAFLYNVGYIEQDQFTTHAQQIEFLRQNRLPVSERRFFCDTLQEVQAAINAIEAERERLDFLIDGAVVEIDDMKTRQALGYTDKFPRWSIAWKFSAQEDVTTLERVSWEVGRTGRLTPLAHLKPVDIGGVTVARATLNNLEDIQRKKVFEGAQVFVRRSNDVIPEVLSIVAGQPPAGPPQAPDRCPGCGGVLSWKGPNLYCGNALQCRPQITGALVHFASRDAMDIEDFSIRTAELLYDKLGVRQAVQLYNLTCAVLEPLDGFGPKKADNLLMAIRRSRDCTLDRFLYALGIANVGRRTAKDLAEAFGSLEALRKADADSLLLVRDIGPVVAQGIVEYFSEPMNAAHVNALLAAGITPRQERASAEGTLAGKSFVITGTLPDISREQATILIEQHGGKVAGSISAKTDFLLAGEKAGSKRGKAQNLGVAIIDWAQLQEMIAQ